MTPEARARMSAVHTIVVVSAGLASCKVTSVLPGVAVWSTPTAW